jgi:hypothetical protein
MKERREKGLYYYCDDKWQPSHKCKSSQLYLLSRMELSSDNSTDEVYFDSTDSANPVPEFKVVECKELEISLNAISGSSGSKLMRLLGYLISIHLSILIDSGSTHNFLDPTVLTKVSLRVTSTSTPSLQVKIANGDSLTSFGKVDVVTLRIQGLSFNTDFYLISLSGCDVVLEVECLRTLGPILWDFSLMTMWFTLRDNLHS